MERADTTATGTRVGDPSAGMLLQSIREDSCHSWFESPRIGLNHE